MCGTNDDQNEPYRGGHGHCARTRTIQFSSQMSPRLSPLNASRANAAIGAGYARCLCFFSWNASAIRCNPPRIVLAVHWTWGGNR